MTDLKIMSETPISAIELKKKLEEIKKRDKELGNKSTRTLEYLNTFTRLTLKEAEDLKQKVISLNIPRLKDRHIIKILDLMPQDIESLKMLFTGENITIKQEDINKIFEAIKK